MESPCICHWKNGKHFLPCHVIPLSAQQVLSALPQHHSPPTNPTPSAAMDWLTTHKCVLPEGVEVSEGLVLTCHAGPAAGHGPDAVAHDVCTSAGGRCVVTHDGFYRIAAVAVAFGAVLMLWLQRVLPRLEQLPLSSWRGARPAAKSH